MLNSSTQVIYSKSCQSLTIFMNIQINQNNICTAKVCERNVVRHWQTKQKAVGFDESGSKEKKRQSQGKNCMCVCMCVVRVHQINVGLHTNENVILIITQTLYIEKDELYLPLNK